MKSACSSGILSAMLSDLSIMRGKIANAPAVGRFIATSVRLSRLLQNSTNASLYINGSGRAEEALRSLLYERRFNYE